MALHAPETNETGPRAGISLCAGYGGLDLGLMLAEPEYRTVAFVEREAHAAATLVARMEDEALDQAPIWDDLKTFDGHPWCGKVDCIAAGYPCQPFSLAGHRKGADDLRHLWPDVARIIREIGPEWVFLENVEGHLTLGFPDVARELEAMDYRVEAGLFSAYEVGAPHWRRRLYILAHSNQAQRGIDSGHRGLPDAPLRGEGLPVRPPAGGPPVDAIGNGRSCAGLAAGGEPSLFAPGPGDLAAWWQVLDGRLDLKPELHRVDDGVADRLDRCGAAGNGVVPLAAALAFRTLKARLMAL